MIGTIIAVSYICVLVLTYWYAYNRGYEDAWPEYFQEGREYQKNEELTQ